MCLAMVMSGKLIIKTSPFVVAPPSSWHTKGMDYHSFHCTNGISYFIPSNTAYCNGLGMIPQIQVSSAAAGPPSPRSPLVLFALSSPYLAPPSPMFFPPPSPSPPSPPQAGLILGLVFGVIAILLAILLESIYLYCLCVGNRLNCLWNSFSGYRNLELFMQKCSCM